MVVNTLSNAAKRAAHIVPFVLLLLAVLFMLSASVSYAAAAPNASGQIDGSDGVNLRQSSSTSSAILDLLPDNTNVTILREVYKTRKSTSADKRWYYVIANGGKGYVRADCIDNIRYTEISGVATRNVAYRKGPGTRMKKKGTLKKGQAIIVCLDARPVKSARGKSKVWYRIWTGNEYGYVCSAYVKISETVTPSVTADNSNNTSQEGSVLPTEEQVSKVVDFSSNAFSRMTASQFENYLTRQGFPEAYKKSLRKLRKNHPNWVFVACKTGMNWKTVLKRQTGRGVSLIYRSYPKSYRSSKYKGQCEPGWYNANEKVVAYFLDPRNFLNEDRVYMFEDLAYQSEYQTAQVVKKIIGGTKLSSYGFNFNVFMNAGKKYNISPVFLAARVVQETGGYSASVNGAKSGGKVVYNPFNIGAYGSNPVARGLKYAKKMGWTTPAKAVNGGASYLASGYISKKQNTVYFQRFNVANGFARLGTHQYMTNIMAPYSEAHITKSSYEKLGICNEPLGFIIPVYDNMPSVTKLP